MDEIDKEKYFKSISKLDSIFRDISSNVTEISKWRCPYKNVSDRCTAKFGCRNQKRTDVLNDLFLCIGSDNLDYRSAWDS
tara:strand:+ start:1304 stop:1543 length:240 start_codon:yes stop_codon:yes gene_type:complete